MNAYILALISAISFALGSVLQQKGTLETRAGEGDPRFLAEILRKPVWLLGGLMQVCGWVFQAVALERGSLVVVQSLISLSLVFALPIGARLTNQHIGRRSVAGACLTLVGIIVFIAIGQPQGGISNPPIQAWLESGIISAGLIGLLAWQATRKRGALSAALFATAAGISFGFQAAVTKEFMTLIGSGLSAILSSWTTYALILTALAGFGLQQSALKTGFLAPAMAASNAATLIMSVVLGIAIFEETLAANSGRTFPSLMGLVLAVMGVLLLVAPDRKELATAS